MAGRSTEPLLSAASVAEMEHGVADTNAGDGSRYGFGWVDSQIGGIRMVGHVGSTTDMASAAFFSPEQKTGVVILLNGQSTLYELAHKPDLSGSPRSSCSKVESPMARSRPCTRRSMRSRSS